MKPSSGILFLAAITAASSACAQSMIPPSAPQLPFYIGGGGGQGHLNRSASDLTGLTNATLNDNDAAWTIRGGWRFNRYLAAEIGYYDFGCYDFHGAANGVNV